MRPALPYLATLVAPGRRRLQLLLIIGTCKYLPTIRNMGEWNRKLRWHCDWPMNAGCCGVGRPWRPG